MMETRKDLFSFLWFHNVMIGIEQVASYIPKKRVSNYERKEEFDIDAFFIEEKIGVKQIALKDKNEDTSDLCVKAFENLADKIRIRKEDIEVVVVVTQNPDRTIPHTSAIVHGKLDMTEDCAAFDISHGCAGYVYGLAIIQSFMNENSMRKGLLFTSDPYSKIVDKSDKNTSLLFGDAASVTLISDDPRYVTGKFTFGTVGKDYGELSCINNKLHMNGRAVFNFTAKYVPKDIQTLLRKNLLDFEDIDKFLFHQGSKYIVDTISKRLSLEKEKVVFDMYDYGNTISSSIPIILEKEMTKKENRLMVLSGFGVGLSWAGVVLKRQKERE